MNGWTELVTTVALTCLLTCNVANAERPLRIFVSDLPSKYNYDLIWNNENAECEYFKARELVNPVGSLLSFDPELRMLRNSSYFGMEQYLHQQLLESPLRTLNIEEADLVYVPVYLIKQAYAWGILPPDVPWYCHSQEWKGDVLLQEFWDEAPELFPRLHQLPHWIGLSQVQLDQMNGCGSNWGWRFLCDHRSSQFTYTVVEHSTHKNGTPVPLQENFVSVPYYGSLHYSSADLTADLPRCEQRQQLVSMCFTTHRSTSVRKVLLADCKAQPHHCRHVDPDNSSTLDWMNAYRSTFFCAQPPGDTPTRLALYDCMAVGCSLPVVFPGAPPYYNYTSMLAFSDLIDYSRVLTIVPEPDLEGFQPGRAAEANSFHILKKKLHTVTLDENLAYLRSVRHVFTYAVHPNHWAVQFSTMHQISDTDDAFTASVKAVLRNLCRRNILAKERCQGS
jgi:hypothetical protein